MEQLLQTHRVFELAFSLTFFGQVPVVCFRSMGGLYVHIQFQGAEDSVVITITVYKKEFGRDFKQIFRLDDQGRCQYTTCVWAQNPLNGEIVPVEQVESFSKDRVLKEGLWHNNDKPSGLLEDVAEILEREDTARVSPLDLCVVSRNEQTVEDDKVGALSGHLGLVSSRFEKLWREKSEE